MEKNRRTESSVSGTRLQKTLWLVLVAVVLYACLTVVPDLVTARLYDLVWATMDS